MKTTTKLALLTALAVTAASTTIYAQSEQAGPPQDAPRGRPAGQRIKALIEKYDADKDGQLDKKNGRHAKGHR